MAAVYETSPIKRQRSTKAEVEARREALLDIIDGGKPMTVRRVFYQATVRGLVEKAESGYAKVQTDLTIMRRNGELAYDWLADNTRWQRKPRTFNGVEEALQHTAEFYRKSLWADADCYAEIWLEKDALAGVMYPVTATYDVPLMVARGYASLSFLHTAAEYINDLIVPTYIYHLGDFDPSGVNAGEKIEATLREMAPDADITFRRLAVTPEQIVEWNLPTRPTKKSDTRSKNFGEISVEFDAIEPNRLRRLVQQAPEEAIQGPQGRRRKQARHHRPPCPYRDQQHDRHRRRGRTMTRDLPSRRPSTTFDFTCANLHYTCSYSRFASGGIAELFLSNHTSNSHADTAARDSAITFSIWFSTALIPKPFAARSVATATVASSGPLAAALDLIMGE
jgi:hypothetical protein